jgi:microcystin-dependent protein
MSDSFLGEIRMMGFEYAPKGWAFCDGAIIGIAQNQALFSLLGTTYGGDGVTTFGLPNLQGRVPIHWGNGRARGESGGEETHLLVANENPSHTHTVVAGKNTADQTDPTNNVWAVGETNYCSATGKEFMSGAAIGMTGGQPHENRSPYLVVNFCISLSGIYPSRP